MSGRLPGMADDPYGVSLEQYTRYVVATSTEPQGDREAIAGASGIPPDHQQEVIEAWGARLSSDRDVLQRHNDLYQQGLAEAGIQRPDISLEQYVGMLQAVQAGTSVEQVTAQHGMTVPQWAMVNQHFGERLSSDPGFAARFAQAMMAGMQGMAPSPSTPPPGPPVV